MEEFATTKCAHFEKSITTHTFSCLKGRLRAFTTSTGATYHEHNESGYKKIWIVGVKDVVERVRSQLEKLIGESTIGDVHMYQIEYMTEAGFFETMKKMHHLEVCEPLKSEKKIVFVGDPSAMKDAKHELQVMLQKITASRYIQRKEDPFIKIFHSENTRQQLSDLLRAKGFTAVYTESHGTFTVYSDNRENATRAMGCLNDLIWEGRYPDDRKFEECEKQCLSTPKWRGKKAELESKTKPLLIQSMDGHSLQLVGLTSHKEAVLKELRIFFRKTVDREFKFKGKGKRVSCLFAFKADIYHDLEKQFSAKIKQAEHLDDLVIYATMDVKEGLLAAVSKAHDSVREDTFTVHAAAMIQQIKVNKSVLEDIGKNNQCIITSHEDGGHSSGNTDGGM